MAGTRSKPDPHYIWIDAADEGEERMKEPPGDWREEMYQVGEGDRYDAGQGEERSTAYKRNTEGRGHELRRRWSRLNLWRGRDYYYDADAIRESNSDQDSGWSRQRLAGVHTRKYTKRLAPERGNELERLKKFDETARLGRNKRSVWSITTENFPGAHFATFPKKLVTPMILAATSHRACEHCAAPWARSVKKSGSVTEAAYTGWLPTCQCEDNGGSARCLVLDPFAGSGTTGVVAAIHGRDYMLFDTNEEYVQMARERIRQEAAQMVMTL